MVEIAGDLARWLAGGEEIALATVVHAEGSSPRALGSRLAVTASGQMAGSVSGGCVEGTVFEEAQEVLASGTPKRLRYGVVDESGWEVGLACGGTIEVYVEPLTGVHRRLVAALEAEETVGLATRLDGGGHLLAWPDGRLEGDRSLAPALTALFPGPAAELRHGPEADVFVEVLAPPPTMVIVGAVHIAVPLVTLAQTLGFHVRLVDARRAIATQDRFPTVDERLGFRLSLAELAQSTLGEPKIADGVQSVEWFNAGEIDKVIEYCKKDVELTVRLFEHGLREGNLLYRDRTGKKLRLLVAWENPYS